MFSLSQCLRLNFEHTGIMGSDELVKIQILVAKCEFSLIIEKLATVFVEPCCTTIALRQNIISLLVKKKT